MRHACLVLVAILGVVTSIGADDVPESKSEASGGLFHNPNPNKCVFQNGKWFCPGGGGSPPVSPDGCRCCRGPPVQSSACRNLCDSVECGDDCACCSRNPSRTGRCPTICAATSCLAFPPETPPEIPPIGPGPGPGLDAGSCRCCSFNIIDRPEGCGIVCAAVSCARPIPPPNPTAEDCGCCEGVRRNIPGCSDVCAADPCPGAPEPPVGCGCCSNNQKKSAECGRLCGLRLCSRPPVPVPPPSKCNCCGDPLQKHGEGGNTVSLTIQGPVCDCRNVFCPKAHGG